MRRLNIRAVIPVMFGLGLGGVPAKAETLKSAENVICFPDDVKRAWRGAPARAPEEVVGEIRKGIPLKMGLTPDQVCNEDVQKALLDRDERIELHLHADEVTETTLLPYLEALKPRLCGLEGPFNDAISAFLRDFPALRSFQPGENFGDEGLSPLSSRPNCPFARSTDKPTPQSAFWEP